VEIVQYIRPEKNHKFQIEIFHKLLQRYPDTNANLVLLGGTRNEKDEELVKGLRKLIDELSLKVFL